MRIPINPLLAKELRLRMRTWRSFAMVSLYLLVLGGLGLAFYAAITQSIRHGFGDLVQAGRQLFIYLAMLQFGLVFFLVPGITAGSITNERERQTFDLLVCTQLTPFGIIRGKLASALSIVFLLILASLPLYSIVFLLGGVALSEVITLFVIFLFTALIYASFAMMFSALFKRTMAAIVASYALSLFLAWGLAMLVAALLGIFYRGTGSFFGQWLLLVHPAATLEWLFPVEGGELISFMNGGRYPLPGFLRFWHLAALVQAALASLALFVATRAVNPLQAGRRSG